MKLFKTTYRLVELSKPRPESQELTGDIREGLRGLLANPFFRYLLTRLQFQRAALKSTLEQTRFAKTEDTTFVQQGIFWTGWLERECNRLTEAPAARELPPTEQEEAAFREIDAMLERVGIDPPQGESE